MGGARTDAGDHKGPPNLPSPPSPLRVTQPPTAFPGLGKVQFEEKYLTV